MTAAKRGLRLFPVVYACQGCPAYGQVARDTAAALERRGKAQMVWLGGKTGAIPRARYPIVALDGCRERCAARWLESRGAVPDSAYVLPADAAAFAQIA